MDIPFSALIVTAGMQKASAIAVEVLLWAAMYACFNTPPDLLCNSSSLTAFHGTTLPGSATAVAKSIFMMSLLSHMQGR